MKRLAIILCVICVLVQPLSKQGILMAYQLNKAYIASELCENRFLTNSDCQGKCHLRKELQKDMEREKQVPRQQQNTIDLIVSRIAQVPVGPTIVQKEENICCLYLTWAYTSPDFAFFHPPRIIA